MTNGQDLSRRVLLGFGAAAAISGCLPVGMGRDGDAPIEPAFRPQPNPAYRAWLEAFAARARAAGISEAIVSRALADAGYLPGVIERDRNQAEFRRSLEDYLALVASEEDVALGRPRFRQWRAVLSAMEARYGVPAQILAAIWGVESAFGTRLGDIPVVSAVSTLAFDGRRGAFFEAQLLAALRILQSGDITPDRMRGSWAGAMGHTQFIPTTYEAYATDFDGDGRRDIWSEDPTDALASAANYLARSGWRSGVPWGLEVRLPSGFDVSRAGRERRAAVAVWQGQGVRRADGGDLPDHGAAAIHAPTGLAGPAFLLFANFDVILRYNASTNYGIGVGYLSDRLAGAGPLRQAFGPDATGLTQAQRRQLQERLTAAGYDAGTPDGVIGARTEAAIRAFQAARGLTVTGQASPDLLAMLR